jgi:preprotein translocase subunit SecD
MKIDLKWRGILILVVIVLAVFYIGPSVTDRIPSFWQAHSRRIHLGLDLQGGTQLLLRVKDEDAVRNTVSQIAGNLRDVLVEDRVRFVELTPQGRQIHVTLLNPQQQDELEAIVSKHYSDLTLVGTKSQDGKLIATFGLSTKEADRIKESTMLQALETIRNRLDPQGIKELDVVAQGADRILIQLPGIENVERAKKMIKRVALLEFKIVDREHSVEEALRGNVPQGSEILYTSKVNPDTGWRTRGSPILVKKETLLTGNMIDKAQVEFDRFGTPRIALSFNSKGAKIFDKIASANVGKELAIILDNTVYSHPVIKQKHYGGNAVIEGSFTLQEARDLVVVLKAGSLPAPVEIEEERTVGPSLGRDSIRAGLISMIAGMGAVVVFMMIYYQTAGLIADIVLALNVLIIMGALAVLRATLTLPGIAGIILTIGMAVDANVLIFERVREELRSGKTFRSALDAGYARAFLTIIDANVTTLIAGIVLFQFGTGPIRGFAITLCIGIVASLFTAVFVSRTIFDYLLTNRRVAQVRV